MQLKFNHLECPFCGHLSRQSQFFCKKCGCDLKHAKTIPVPIGQLAMYQEMHSKPAQRLLLDHVEDLSSEAAYRKFVQLSGNVSLNSGLWRHGREMNIETKNFTFYNFLYIMASFGILIYSSLGHNRWLFYLYTLILIIYGLYRRYVTDKDGDTIIINENALEVRLMNSRNNLKLDEIEWDDVDRIFREENGENIRLCFLSKDGKKQCKLPIFYKRKRTMMLNSVGIMAHKKNIRVE